MTKISRISSVSLNRIKNSYINRTLSTNLVDDPERLTPVSPAKNQVAYSSENHLLAYEEYYKKFKHLKKEFQLYMGNAEYLKNELKDHKKDKEKNLTIYGKVKSLVNNFNSTVDSIIVFDKLNSTANVQDIQEILKSHETSFKNLGISVENVHLHLNKTVFFLNYYTSFNPYEELFSPLNTCILGIYITLRNMSVRKQNKYNHNPENYKGHFINKTL